jgi:hypothetical protein
LIGASAFPGEAIEALPIAWSVATVRGLGGASDENGAVYAFMIDSL